MQVTKRFISAAEAGIPKGWLSDVVPIVLYLSLRNYGIRYTGLLSILEFPFSKALYTRIGISARKIRSPDYNVDEEQVNGLPRQTIFKDIEDLAEELGKSNLTNVAMPWESAAFYIRNPLTIEQVRREAKHPYHQEMPAVELTLSCAGCIATAYLRERFPKTYHNIEEEDLKRGTRIVIQAARLASDKKNQICLDVDVCVNAASLRAG